MQLNLIYDDSTDAAPAGFTVALAAAAQYLDGLITNPITVNISVGFGEDDGAPLSDDESSGGPSSGIDIGYAQLVQYLTANISSAQDAEAVANLPANDPTGGAQFYISSAQEKAWGIIPAGGTTIDGTVGFSSTYPDYNYDPNNRAQPGLEDFVGVAEHELTHTLGRLVDTGFTTVMDLFRYSAPGVRELVSGQPAYFSIDDGTTDLDNYDTSSDPADWSVATGPDSFDAFSETGVENPVTPVDITEMNVLGFAVDTPPSTVTAYTVSDEAGLNGALAAIQFSAADLTYSITLAAGLPDGVLTLDAALFSVVLPSGATLFIAGAGQTIDGGSQAGFSVVTGNVAIENLTIAGMVRAGGAGSAGAGGGGGGAGIGGALIVGSGGTVTLSNVEFSGDAAVGGAGGDSENDYSGGNGGEENGGTVDNGATSADAGGGDGGYGEGGGGGGSAYLGAAAGPGGAGGFGGGGGGGGYYQIGQDRLGGAAGFGAGDGGAANGATNGGGGGGGGGMAAGGDVFVAPGGVLYAESADLGLGSATGGDGGAGGQTDIDAGETGHAGGPGGGFGGGIFIAGTQQIVLGPSPSETVTIAGGIDDQTGSGGTGADAGTGSLALTNGGTVRLAAAGDYTGGTFLEGGDTLDLAATGAAGNNSVVFLSTAALRIEAGVTVENGLLGFGTGDLIDLVGIDRGSVAGLVSFDASASRLTVTGGGTATVQLDPTLQYVPDWFHASLDPGGGGTTISYVACFAAGTRLATPIGGIPVEWLRVGDMVNTACGAPRRIVWLGHRGIDCRRHPRPLAVRPVRVAAGAFGAGRPLHDLWLSPDHAVFMNGRDPAQGALIPIRYLVNGATIAQEKVDWVTYWHVELERHEVILAEGLPCESYLDTGNRNAFAAETEALAPPVARTRARVIHEPVRHR